MSLVFALPASLLYVESALEFGCVLQLSHRQLIIHGLRMMPDYSLLLLLTMCVDFTISHNASGSPDSFTKSACCLTADSPSALSIDLNLREVERHLHILVVVKFGLRLKRTEVLKDEIRQS